HASARRSGRRDRRGGPRVHVAGALARSVLRRRYSAATAGAAVAGLAASSLSSFLKRWKIVAAIGPLMLCQTLKMALGTAASGEKWAVAKATPRPEFCMPTSIDKALRCATFRRNSLASR